MPRENGTASLDGKVVLITGTGSGMGRAAAQLFAEAGALVVGGDVAAEGAAETLEMVTAAGGRMTSVHPLDFADPEAVEAWVLGAVTEFGGVDVLYNNASSTRFGNISEMSDEDWRFVVRNELDLVFVTTRAVWPHLAARGGGAIVNVGSLCGHIAMLPGEGQGFAHATAKHGVIGMTRELAGAGGKDNIRVNSISPGAIVTAATAAMLEVPGLDEALLRAQIIKRLGQPEDVVRAAMFLASDDASFITGQDLIVDGGYSAK